MKKLSIIFLVAAGVLSANARDVITLNNGDEISAKVTEITSSEIRYKQFDDRDSPTVVVAKQEVFAIDYENDTREIISAETATARTATNSSLGAPHEKDFYTGIYLNPLGVLQVGPIVGVEFTIKRRFIIDAHLRFPAAGLLTGYFSEGHWDVDNIKGISTGLAFKYFTGGPKGGFYAGPGFEYYQLEYHVDGGFWEGTGMLVAANFGYKFQYSSGFYMRAGAFLGASTEFTSYWRGSEWPKETDVFFMAEFSLGFAF